MKVGELFVQLGVLADSKNLREFTKAVGDMPLEIASGIAALVGLEFEFTKLAQEAMNTAVGFEAFTSQTGLSWKELQRWQIVAAQANVSAESVASSVSALERNLADIRLGRGNVSPFQLLGIGVNQNAFGVLAQLRERIKGMDRPTATNIVSQMGLSPDMMQVLQLTDREFTDFMNHAHGMTERQYQDFTQARLVIVQWNQAFKETMFELVSHFTEAIEKSLAFKRVLIGVGVVAGALAAFFFPVTAAIVGLVLALDDLATYFNGGESVFGDAINGLKKFTDEFKKSPIATLGSQLANVLPSLGLPGFLAQGVVGAAQNKSLQNIFNISVTGAGPATAIAQEVTRQITKHFGKAEQEFNNQGH